MARWLPWVGGLAGSALLHAGAAGVYLATRSLDEAPTQQSAETRLQLETVTAPTADAVPQTPDSDSAAEGAAESTALGAGAVPQSSAQALAAPTQSAQSQRPDAQALTPSEDTATALAPATPNVASPEAVTAPADRLSTATPQAEPVAAAAPNATSLSTASAPAEPVAALAAPATQKLAPSEDTATALAPATPAVASSAAIAAPADSLTTASPQTVALAAAAPNVTFLSTASVEAAPVAVVAAPTAQLAAAVPPVSTVSPTTPPVGVAPEPVILAALPAQAAALPDSPQVAASQPQSSVAPAARPESETAAPAPPNSTNAAPAPATGTPAALATASAETPEEPPLPAQSATANLAWQFGDRLVTDPQALATIQAFMTPNAIDNAADVKDDLSALLTGTDCARLSATFIPEDGVLEMRGHIPDPALQDQIMSALRAQVGDGIPVRANLLHLPAPQCGALTGIAAVGLPQSTDQFTDSRLIGESAHATEYVYAEGRPLSFDMQAPDYDAVVYVDYFDADGQVIHLQPNLTGSSDIHTAKSTVPVRPMMPGTTNQPIIIGPPFGQEIAVAFAASEPLYDTPRPTIEPAEPYLDWLASQVAAARAADPDFKGEWAYFFIITRPATQ